MKTHPIPIGTPWRVSGKYLTFTSGILAGKNLRVVSVVGHVITVRRLHWYERLWLWATRRWR